MLNTHAIFPVTEQPRHSVVERGIGIEVVRRADHFAVMAGSGHRLPAVRETPEVLGVGLVALLPNVVVEAQRDAGQDPVAGETSVAVVEGVVRQGDDPLVVRRAGPPPAQALEVIGDRKVAQVRRPGGLGVLDLVVALREPGLRLQFAAAQRHFAQE